MIYAYYNYASIIDYTTSTTASGTYWRKEQHYSSYNILGKHDSPRDLRLTSGGEYVFLEVNPSGQYLFIELLTQIPLSERMAEFLAN